MSSDTIIMRRNGDRLVPVAEWERERLMDIPEGRDLTVKITRTRSPKQHRLFWALMQLVVKNHPYYVRAEQLVEWMKVRLGYVEEVMFHDGQLLTKVSSISFGSMGQDEFQNFFNLAMDVITTEVLPDTSREDLLRELEQMLGEKWIIEK
jgi:Protein of unknown function (DUF1367)